MPPELDSKRRADWPRKVWLVMGYRAGECSQILALGEALGWPFEVKRLVYRSYYFLASLPRRVSSLGIDKRRSSPLQPPWPDLVISAGFRNEPVCRWIKQQAGDKTRLVHIGRPWAGLEQFDLVITTPQYRLPSRPNVLHNQTTLQGVTEHSLAEAAARWAPRVAHLPRPYISVVVGGHSGPFTFDRQTAERLGRGASAMANRAGGSLLVTTSARTPESSTVALAANISSPVEFFHWSPNSPDNPYFGYLALADSIIVTGDSIAMLSEACATRKPVYIFDLGGMQAQKSPGSTNRFFNRQWWTAWSSAHVKAFFYRQLMRMGPRRLSRDLGLVHQHLIACKRAVWLGDSLPHGFSPPPLEDVQRAVERIRALPVDSAAGYDHIAKHRDTDLRLQRNNKDKVV